MSVGFSRLVRRVATSWDFLITILLGMLPIQWADIGKIAKSEDFILPMDWNQWLGPAKWRPYHPTYAPFVWRGWLDFGTGALGDMGAH